MFRFYTVLLFLFCSFSFSTGSAFAQSTENCDTTTLGNTLANYATAVSSATYDEIKNIADEMNTLLSAYVNSCSETNNSASSANELFTVQATGNVNIRDCGETTCSVISVATAGRVYSVIGQSGDWYEIRLEDGQTGYIASWLTVRGPDVVFDIYEGYLDVSLDCSVKALVSRSASRSVSFAISGERMDDVTADILRPNSANAEPVWQQLPKTFIDTGDVYIHQVYLSSYWPVGNYQVRVSLDGESRLYGFELTETGQTIIYVFCG